MLVNHKFQFFRFSWKFIFIGQFLFCYHSSIMLLSSCLLFYMCCFLIRLFAVWRYAGRIFNAGICRGKAISEFRSPKALPLHPHPLGHGRSSALLCVLRCWLLSVCCGTQNGTLCRSGSWILRYLWWYAVPIWLLYSSIFMVVRCADLVSGFWILDSLMFLWCFL